MLKQLIGSFAMLKKPLYRLALIIYSSTNYLVFKELSQFSNATYYNICFFNCQEKIKNNLTNFNFSLSNSYGNMITYTNEIVKEKKTFSEIWIW